MAERKFLIATGQSNAEPTADYDDWRAARVQWDLQVGTSLSLRPSIGSYTDKLAMPGGFPGYSTIDLRWRALRGCRYCVFYNPLASGYQSYPGTGRLSAGNHTSTTIRVHQVFTPGETLSIVRARDGATYSATVANPARQIASVTVGTETITLDAAHGFAAGEPIRFYEGAAGVMPSGAVFGKVYYVRNPSGADLQIAETVGGAAVLLDAGFAGVVYVRDDADTIGSVLTVVDWTDPLPDEQFTYKLKTTTTHGGAPTLNAVLGLHFGMLWQGTLLGLSMTCTVGAVANVGQTRIISAWDNASRTVTFSSAWPASIDDDDEFTIQPQGGVAYDRWCFWLPWSPFEGEETAGHTNPYPPGFDYPGQYHVPIGYHPKDTDAGTYLAAITKKAAWHTGLALGLRSYLGEEIYVLATGVGNTAMSHNELPSDITAKTGWFDGTQMNTWSPGEANNCYQRLLDELAAAIVAAAAVGDTLRCIGVFDSQGESDAQLEDASLNYADNKRAFKDALRQALVDLDLWDRSAESIPWVQIKLQTEDASGSAVWPFDDNINAAIDKLVDEDRFMRTFAVDGDNYTAAHLNEDGVIDAEEAYLNAYVDIVKSTAQDGEVDICNLALSFLGDTSRVTSIDPEDGSAQATHCAQFYPIARDAVLEMRHWSFALKRVSMVGIESTWPQWPFAYQLPADVLKALAVLPPEASDDNFALSTMFPSILDSRTLPEASGAQVPLPFIIELAPDGTRILYTTCESAVLRYVAKITDARRYPPIFKTALAWKLASMLAGPVTGDQQKSQQALSMMYVSLNEAASSDSQQRQVQPTHVSPWHRAR